MVLEGVVTNLAAFAFVDVGVDQDALVHISAIAKCLCQGPTKVSKPGDIVRVKVLEVDPKRRRISLTMRLEESPGTEADGSTHRIRPSGIGETSPTRRDARKARSNPVPASSDAMTGGVSASGVW